MSRTDLIDSLGDPEFEAALDRFLETVLPLDSIGMFYWRDTELPEPEYDRYDKVNSKALYQNLRKIFPINPIAQHKIRYDRPTIFSYDDIPPTENAVIRAAMDRGVPVHEAPVEAMGFRPDGWPEALDDLKIYLPLPDGRNFVISMKRLMKFGGFTDSDRSAVIDELEFLSAIVRKHVDLRARLEGLPAGNADSVVRLVSPANEPGIKISEKEKEAIRWAVAGKTMEEISIITGISARTIRYYLYSVRDRYGYATVQQTLVRAAKDFDLEP